MSDLEDDVIKELASIKGDAIGDTLYSERWVLRVLIKLSELSESSWDDDLEQMLCALWDMTSEKDVVIFLLKNNIYDVFCQVVNTVNIGRCTEIMVGILGNMCCVEEARASLSEHNASLVVIDLITSQVSVVLVQVVRLLNACLWNLRTEDGDTTTRPSTPTPLTPSNETACVDLQVNSGTLASQTDKTDMIHPWLTIIIEAKNLILNHLVFFLTSATSEELLCSSLELLDTFLSIPSLRNESMLSTSPGIAAGLAECLKQLLKAARAADSLTANRRLWRAIQLWMGLVGHVASFQAGRINLGATGSTLTKCFTKLVILLTTPEALKTQDPEMATHCLSVLETLPQLRVTLPVLAQLTAVLFKLDQDYVDSTQDQEELLEVQNLLRRGLQFLKRCVDEADDLVGFLSILPEPHLSFLRSIANEDHVLSAKIDRALLQIRTNGLVQIMDSVLPYKSRDSMKTIDVIFVSDNLVCETIVSRKEYERLQQRKQKIEEKERQKEAGVDVVPPTTPRGRKRKSEGIEQAAPGEVTPKKSKYDDIELALAALENVEVKEETILRPSTLFDEEADVSAGKLYSFESKKTYARSPLAKTAMINAANCTPKSKEIHSQAPLERIEEEEPPQTPYSLRKRVKKDIRRIQKILENSDEEKDFSASDSDYSESSGEEDDYDDDDDDNCNKKMSAKSYFEIPSVSKNKSGRTLKNLSTPRLTREAVNKVFEQINVGEAHKPHLTQLFRSHFALYDKWDFILRHNYNVLLYGVGSKKDLIDKYLSRFVKHHPVIKVNGFFPSITVKDILEQICECLKIDASGEILEKIVNKVKEYDITIYIGINDIDGVMLRSRKNQQVIASLARLPQIRLLASVDHINAPLMWDHCLLTDFNWVWLDATTFLPYTEETSYEGSILMQSSGQQTLSSLRSVYGSLTKNSRGLFLILAKAQVGAEKDWQGMPFRELYQQGRRQMLFSADTALRLQLKEFIDHAVVKQKRSAEGEEIFHVTMETSILRQFLEEQEGS